MRSVLLCLLSVALAAVPLACAQSAADEALPYAVVRTADGVLIVWNESQVHFTLRLAGEDVWPSKLGGVALTRHGR